MSQELEWARAAMGLPGEPLEVRTIPGNPSLSLALCQVGPWRASVFLDQRLLVASAGDFLDLMGLAPDRTLALAREQLHPDFFELRTGLAGEILQKVSNYRCRLGIFGDFSAVPSRALRDFIYESNRTRQVMFLPGLAAWSQALAGELA